MAVLLRQVVAEQHRDAAWRWVFRRQLSAVVRRQALAGTDLPPPYGLAAYGFRLRSQNDEDGITLTLLKAAGVTNRRFVEIGSGSSGGNSAILAFDCGWSGLMIEASKGKAAKLRSELAFNQGVTVLAKRVTPGKVNQLLKHAGYTGDVDFMSIDVDSVDYWIFDALKVCSPRVLVMEYNAFFGPEQAVTLPMEGLPDQFPRGYFGASLAAIEKKARQKGYRLVHCEDTGVNAFFLRNDVAPEIPPLPPSVAYRPFARRTPDAEGGESDIFQVIERQGLPLVRV